jgi:putative membrane protein
MLYKFDFPKILFVIFAGAWIFLSIEPLYPFAWKLENIVVFIFLPIVILSYFKFRLSNFSYLLIFIFGILHLLGAHYTYGNTPWGDLITQTFDLGRNHYDRIVHFIYGVLMVPVLIDLFKRYLPKNWFIKGIFIFSIAFAIGSLYEVGEFVVGVIVDPEAGLAFLGFQGDIWDTQKDMSLQGIGALVGLVLFMPFSRFFSFDK